MKKLLAPFILLFCLGMMISCSKTEVPIEPDPVVVNAKANFEYEPGDDPFTFKFKNLSTEYKRVEWRFGDDTLSVADNPEHVYLTAGTFTVDLRAISETGAVSRKVVNLVVKPESIFSIVATPTGTPNMVKYSAESTADIVKTEWRMTDDTRKTTHITIKDEATPTYTMPVGRLAPVSLKITTAKGSTATLTKNSSPVGLITNFMSDMTAHTASADNQGNPNERVVKLFDNVDSKFLINFKDVQRTWNVVMEFSKAHTMKFYCIGNGNDAENRDPKVWKMEGSNDKTNWTLVDSRDQEKTFTAQLFDRGFQNTDQDLDWKKFYFVPSNPGSYKYYRMTVTSTFNNDDLIQFGEITFFE